MNEKDNVKRKKTKENKDISKNLQTPLSPELLRVSQNVNTDELKQKFPSLHSEMVGKTMKLDIDEVKGQFTPSKTNDEIYDSTDPFRAYVPTITDYICRARTKQEAKEIIEFSLSQNNITEDEAFQLKTQLEEQGLRSFGPFRENGHYFRKAIEMRNREVIRRRYSIPDKK